MEEEEVGIGRRRKTYPKPVRHLRKEGMLQIKFFFQKTKEGKKRMRKVSGLLSKQTTYDLIISNQKREEQLWPNLFPIFALQLGFNHEENYRLFNLFGHIKNNHIYHDMKTGCCGFEKLIIFSRQSILKKFLHCLYARLVVKLMHPSVKWTQKVGNFAALLTAY